MDSRPSVDPLAQVVVPTDHQRRKSNDNLFRDLTDDKKNNFTLYRNCNICSEPLPQDEDDISIQDMDVEDIHYLNSSSSMTNAPSRRKISTSTPSILAYCIEKFTLRKNAVALKEATTETDDSVYLESRKDGPISNLHNNDLNSLTQQFEAFKLNIKMTVRSQSQTIQNRNRRKRISQENNGTALELPKAFDNRTEDSRDKDAFPFIQKDEPCLKRRKLNREENSANIESKVVEKKFDTDRNKIKVMSSASAAFAEDESKPVAHKNKKRSIEESNQSVVKEITKIQPPVKKLKPNLQELERDI